MNNFPHEAKLQSFVFQIQLKYANRELIVLRVDVAR